MNIAPAEILLTLAVLAGVALQIYLAYLTARNERWGWFVLGFLCGFGWLIGALLGPRQPNGVR